MDVAAEVDPSESLLTQRAEEFVEQISNKNAVSSESVSLVVASSYLDLQVTEEQVIEATLQILKPRKFSSRRMFSLSVWSCCDGRHLRRDTLLCLNALRM